MLKAAAPVKYYYVGPPMDASKLRYEHIIPTEYIVLKLTQHFYGKKIDLKALKDKYNVAIVPKTMDKNFDVQFQKVMPTFWNETMSETQRYFGELMKGFPNMYALEVIGGKDKGKIIGEEFVQLSNSIVNAEKINKKEATLSKVINTKNMTNEQIIGQFSRVDKALKFARDPNTPVRKIRVFDFDDTLAKSKSLVFYNRPNETSKPVPNNKAIFMIGGPGSGKSNIGKGLQLGRDGWKVVNQDIFIEAEKAKQGLPEIEKDYTKEQRSKRAKIGAAGRKAAEAKMDKYTKAGNGMVIDGTGASYNATMKKVNKLKEQGYEVFMVHAKTSNEVALERNRARKERSLPDFIVEKTQQSVNNNISQYKNDLGDNFIEIDTETIEYGKPLPKEFVDDAKTKFYATERGKLNAEEFAQQGAILIEEGFAMDFSDFNIVREGEKGPLFDVAKKIQKARGTDDVFVLTARAPESQQAIYEFLKSEGLEIPLENITGLGNSTGEAKANWLVNKAAEGYNDFYFADDAYQNVKAVKDAMSVLDVKSKVQQAKGQFSKNFNEDFNKIIEQTTGIASEKVYSKAKAKVRGANKGNKKFFIPYSAEDFMGLIYPLLSKGKLGDSQMAWFKKNLLDPYARAQENISADRLQLMEDFKALKKALDVPKDLRKKTDSGFTKEQAVRVYLFNKAGFDVPGISKTDLNELLDLVNSDGILKAFADQIFNITKGDGYAKPGENWLVGTITTDLIDVLNTVKRAKYLEQSGYTANAELIFSKENLNKLEAAYGTKYREAMENILGRMKSGKNRLFSGNRLSNRVLDYINNSTGAIMFFNTRSAVLQTISAINFLNWSFNNPIKAGAAFANQKQYWKDFVELINSDYLVDRRNGLKLNINESEIADAAATSKNKARAAINYILQKGFLPTQYADSFAIASGGATFYRNRINDLVKNQGMTEADAKKQAMLEWRETAEISQQSSDPSKISAQQASDLGRVILAFANTPMQYARIQKRALQDLVNGRGDAKTHVSKIIYYAVVQNLIFNALQSALFGLGFGDDEDDEKKEKMYLRTANGMLDSQLRGLGLAGATVAVIKNFLADIYERSGRSRPEYVDSVYELLRVSPPISSKISKIRQAAYQFDSKKRREEIFDKGFSIDNPAYEAGAKVISATANIPLDRVYSKIDNISGAMDEDAETWQTVAMLAGWPKWTIMPKEKSNQELPKFPGVKIKKFKKYDYKKKTKKGERRKFGY
jgi:dephospho-CoA kinase